MTEHQAVDVLMVLVSVLGLLVAVAAVAACVLASRADREMYARLRSWGCSYASALEDGFTAEEAIRIADAENSELHPLTR